MDALLDLPLGRKWPKGSSKQAGGGERRALSAEFKPEEVRLMAERRAAGTSLAQIGRDLLVRPSQLRAWANAKPFAGTSGGAVPGETLKQENRRLRPELVTLQL